VRGASALIWGANPDLTWQEVKARILNWVDQKGAFSQCLSKGRLNLFKALTNP
jgi:hypothetical protein